MPDVALVAIDPQERAGAARVAVDAQHLTAQALRRLDAAGAKVIAIDIDLSAARCAAEHAEFSRRVVDSGRVVLVSVFASGQRHGQIEVASSADSRARVERRGFSTPPIPAALDASAGIGRLRLRSRRRPEVSGAGETRRAPHARNPPPRERTRRPPRRRALPEKSMSMAITLAPAASSLRSACA